MIISASRRTDIPAFYHEWFMNRIRAGFLLTRNPFNYNQIGRVSLLPEDVDAIVFWTRNPSQLFGDLDELTDRGFRYYFQYTITGYPRTLESHTLNPYKALSVFKRLSDKIGKEKVIWRYDPILLSNILPIDEHLRLFEKIAAELSGYTNRVVISFADLYEKVARNLGKVEELSYQDICSNKNMVSDISRGLASIAKNKKIEIYSCSEEIDLSSYGIQHGKCIDDKLINDVFDVDLNVSKDPGQREACGCVKSIDIGAYNSCLHGCKYCYATHNESLAKTNYKKHNPLSPFLLGDADGVPSHFLEPNLIQQSLF